MTSEFFTGRSQKAPPCTKPRECFGRGTRILLPDGTYRPIENIVKGDLVASYDGAEDEGRGKVKIGQVTKVFHNPRSIVVEFKGQKATLGHKVLSAWGEFVTIGEILKKTLLFFHFEKEGYPEPIVISRNGEPIPVKLSDFGKAHFEDTFNFEVEGYHTYITDILRVHNNSVDS